MKEEIKKAEKKGRREATEYIKSMMIKEGITIDNGFWGGVFKTAETGDKKYGT